MKKTLSKNKRIMRYIAYIFTIFLGIVALSCSDTSSPAPASTPTIKPKVEDHPKKFPTIEIYTLGKVNDCVCAAMVDSLKKVYPDCRYITKLPLLKSAWYQPRQRYLADSLTKYLGKRHTSENIVIGLTEVDISIALHGSKNYGIMGLTNRVGGGVCVFSTFRKKDPSGLFCLMKHELAHAFGLKHCKTHNCLMHDAEGSDLKGNKFCPQCSSFLKAKGWKLED